MATALNQAALVETSNIAQMETNRKLGYLFACCATVCWSGTGIFIDALTSHYPITPLELSFWRTLLVVGGLGLFLLRGGHTRRATNFRFGWREIPFYLVYGVIGVGVFNLTWSNSVAINKAAIATALLFCSPVFVVIGARWFFGERIRWPGFIAIALDLSGVFLVAGAFNVGALIDNFAGLVYAVGSGFTFAIYTLWGKMGARAGIRSSTAALFYTFLFALCGLLAWGLVQEGQQLFITHLDLNGWLLLTLLAFGPTLGGYAFFGLAIKHLEAGVISIFNTLEPPIAAVLAWLLLGRVLNWWQWLGAVLIVAGVLMLQSGGRIKFFRSNV